MSFGDFEYQETTSNQLARILKGMRQEQIILDAVQNPIDDVEEYPDARQVESVKGTKDHIGAVTIPLSKSWHYANEPNDTTRLWLWFREGWRLRDYSRHGNEAFAQQVEPSPVPVRNYVPLRRKVRDDGTTSGRLYGIIDGISQYYRVLDGPENRLTDLLSTNNEFCFSCFFSPFESYTFDEVTDRLVFTQKLDDDQSNNAVRVELEEDGTVHFYLVYKGTPYHTETAPGIVPLVDVPEFEPGEFIDEEFLTQSPNPWQWNPNVAAPDWTWLFFSFDKTTRQLKIFRVKDGGVAATELVTTTAAPDDNTILANVSMWLPANENDPEAIGTYDITGNENHALFRPVPNAPTYVTDGFLHFTGDNCAARIDNSLELTNTTSYTIAFKIRLHSYAVGATIDTIFQKNYHEGPSYPGGGGFLFYMGASGSTTLVFDVWNPAGTYRTVTATAAIASLNTWYNVILTYDGTTYTLRAGAVTGTPLTAAGDTITTTDGGFLGDTVSSFQGDIADVVFVKNEAWSTAKRNQYIARTPGFRSTDWPAYKPPKPPEPETPLPVVRPVEKVYELILPDTIDVKRLNNPATTTPFVSIYNVPGGTPSTVPETLKYDCADGTTGGSSTSPVTTIYNLAAASSTGSIAWGSSERGYVQRIKVVGSVLLGKNPTDMQFYVKNGGSASGGTLYCALFRNDGTYTKFGTGMAVSSVSTSSWVPITGTSFVTRTGMVMGDGVGVVWEGGSSGTMNVQRGGQNVFYDKDGSNNPYSWQDHLETGSVYGSDNDEYAIAGVVKDGGIVTAGANPYAKLTLSQYVLGIYQVNSTCEGILPTRVIWRVRRVGSAASATLKCYILNASGTVLKTIDAAKSFNSISTTVQDLEFIDRDNTVAWADTYMVALGFDVKTGINNTTVYLEVNYNVGSGSGVVEGTAIKARMYNGTSAYVDVSPVCDWAGKIYVGGSSFTAYKQFTPTQYSMGEKVNSGATPLPKAKLFGEKFSKLKATMKKVGNPTGPIRAYVWDNVGNGVVTFPTIVDASSLTTSDADYIFTFPTNAYNSQLNDRIGLQYAGATSTDYVLVKINTDAAAGAAGDTTKSILSMWTNGVGWSDEPTMDFAFEVFTGGVPDLVSRSKAAIRCDSIFSILNRKKITRAVIPLKKIGAPTGTYYIRSVRGSDGSNRDLLGSGDIAALSTSTWTYKDVSNYNALHFMGESDKFVVEYEGGDTANGLLVQVWQDSTYDDADTRYEDFDSVNWNTAGYDTWDMGATLYTGGDTYIPDAGTPYVPPPDYYDHDWLIGSGAYIKGVHTSFYGMRIRDFKIETSIPSLEQIDTLYDNKYSRRGGKGEVALIGYCTYNTETTPPAP